MKKDNGTGRQGDEEPVGIPVYGPGGEVIDELFCASSPERFIGWVTGLYSQGLITVEENERLVAELEERTAEIEAEELPMTGAQMIAAERDRQIGKHGYTAEHDAGHGKDELRRASIACLYASVGEREGTMVFWPFTNGMPDLNDSEVRNLVKAGALIAAQIDQLLAARKAVEA